MKRVLFAIAVIAISTNLAVPFFPLYQELFHANSFTSTGLFVTYVVFLLPTLLISGSIGDYFGYKWVVVVALLLTIVSAGLFIFTPNLWVLYVARAIVGISVGLFMGTGNALLLQVSSRARMKLVLKLSGMMTLIGFGLGPAISSIILQYSKWNPEQLSFLLLSVAAIIAILMLFTLVYVKDSHTKQIQFRIQLGIPQEDKQLFWKAVGPSVFLLFSIGGMLIATLPTFVKDVMHLSNHAWSGLLLLIFLGGGAFAQFIPFSIDHIRRIQIGLILLFIGFWCMLTAGAQETMGLLWFSILLLSIGNGWVFQSCMGLSGDMGKASDNARVISTFYVMAYLGMSIPTLAVGLLTLILGLIPALIILCACVTVLGLWIIWSSGHLLKGASLSMEKDS
ncbi:MFS transporter [Priestia megaterium]|uniref:MFS transporter n=1 Tax=Priestia megaterium TaxID=1404 RepID=UPI001C221061|nr:MFS transporter [Priestia megaterium]MBU8589704.1 MFS transporter [Priestia megaterium]MBV6738627.1 MFS transporter [Priestia megaterium]